MTGEGVPTPCQYCTVKAIYSKCTSEREAALCDNRALVIDPAFPAAVYGHDLFPPPASKVPMMGTRVNEMQSKLASIMLGGCTCLTKTNELKYHKENCHYRLASEVSELLRGMA